MTGWLSGLRKASQASDVGSNIRDICWTGNVDVLVLDGGTDGDSNDLEGELEIIVDGQSGVFTSKHTTPVEDVIDNNVARVLRCQVSRRDGEVDDLCGFAGKVDLGQVASTN